MPGKLAVLTIFIYLFPGIYVRAVHPSIFGEYF
jgi:hypothetical protein